MHGDFRLDNALVHRATRHVLAIIDWEMSPWDPLTDLGMLYLFWEGWRGLDNPIAATPVDFDGFPLGKLTGPLRGGHEPRSEHFDWYAGFAFFKLAVICEGIHYRFVNGQTVGEGSSGSAPGRPAGRPRPATLHRHVTEARAQTWTFAFDARPKNCARELTGFMSRRTSIPAEPEFEREAPGGEFSWERPPAMPQLQAEARRRGLWNLFLPHSPSGAGLTQRAVRAPGGDQWPQPPHCPGGDELRGPGHREHGAAGHVRHGGTARDGGSSRC